MHAIENEISFLVLSCIFEPLDRFAGRVDDCLKRTTRSTWSMTKGNLDVRKVYFPRPQRGGIEPMRVVMWSPRSRPDVTAFYPNSSSGWSTLITRLSSEGMPDCISIRSTQPPEEWSLQEVRYVASGDRRRRVLQLLEEEGGTELYEEGAPFDFEDLSVEARDRIATRADVLSFVAKLGVDLRDPEFWRTDKDAIYLHEQRRVPAGPSASDLVRRAAMVAVADRLPHDADGDALRQLVATGSDLSKPMDVHFAVRFSDTAVGSKFAAAVEPLGFRTTLRQDEEAGGWVCYCSRMMIPSYDEIVAIQTTLEGVGREYDATLDGWGSLGNADDE